VNDNLNDDLQKRAEMRTASMEWQASPSPTVTRKRLDLIGAAERGRVTSIVRYAPNSRFAAHDHPAGEEILVLEGTFSDEHGDYPAGSYILNPEGFRHTPSSELGCLLFVKLCQYEGPLRPSVRRRLDTMAWTPGAGAGQHQKVLYDGAITGDGTRERVCVLKLDPGAAIPRHSHPGGEEFLILDGDLTDAHGKYGPGTWVRYPNGSSHEASSQQGCIMYVKNGHLPG
jgi:anti-sigma factor ChrR (cupin superfamily)